MQLTLPFAPFEFYNWYHRDGKVERFHRDEVQFYPDGSWKPTKYV
jgi:hypothetical protein